MRNTYHVCIVNDGIADDVIGACREILKSKYKQKPQLSSSHRIVSPYSPSLYRLIGSVVLSAYTHILQDTHLKFVM